MTDNYRAIMLTRRGGPEVLEQVELPVRPPGPGEVRLQVRGTGAGGTDVLMRRGHYLYAPRLPFVPGYEVVGDVEAVGSGVSEGLLGQRFAALIGHGGYAEKLVLHARELVPVPAGQDVAEVVALILNYVTAYQAMHRSARLRPGQTALVTGANGGVGSALLELLRLSGVQAIGAAAPSQHDFITSLGAQPVASRGRPLAEAVRELVPGGVDATFDGLGGAMTAECIRATRRAGSIVGYGFAAATMHGRPSRLAMALGLGTLLLGAALSGRRGRFYGITALYRRDPTPFQQDSALLFQWLSEGKLRPRIAHRLPLLAARQANELLEAGGVEGKIVHLA